MGVWSERPLCSDEALDAIGRYEKPEDKYNTLVNYLHETLDIQQWIAPCYHVLALLIQSFGINMGYDLEAVDTETIDKLKTAINTNDGKFDGDYVSESSETFMNICSMPLEKRKELVEISLKSYLKVATLVAIDGETMYQEGLDADDEEDKAEIEISEQHKARYSAIHNKYKTQGIINTKLTNEELADDSIDDNYEFLVDDIELSNNFFRVIKAAKSLVKSNYEHIEVEVDGPDTSTNTIKANPIIFNPKTVHQKYLQLKSKEYVGHLKYFCKLHPQGVTYINLVDSGYKFDDLVNLYENQMEVYKRLIGFDNYVETVLKRDNKLYRTFFTIDNASNSVGQFEFRYPFNTVLGTLLEIPQLKTFIKGLSVTCISPEEYFNKKYPNGLYIKKAIKPKKINDYIWNYHVEVRDKFYILADVNTGEAIQEFSEDVNTNLLNKSDMLFLKHEVELLSKFVKIYGEKPKASQKQTTQQNIQQAQTDNTPGLKIKIVNRWQDKHNKYIYAISDGSKVMNVAGDRLKEEIRAKRINCLNATLTSDNRLIIKK